MHDETCLRRKLKRGKLCQSIAHGRAYHCTDCAPLLKKSRQAMSRATHGPCVWDPRPCAIPTSKMLLIWCIFMCWFGLFLWSILVPY